MKIKRMFLGLIIGLLPMTAMAIPMIGFDDGFTTQTGTLTYDGIGGAAIGTGILFDSILGTDTATNAGNALTCTSCIMNFITGGNTQEGPGQNWLFGDGGSISITGSAYNGATLIASGVLATGSFISTPTVVGIGTTSALFAGFGIDTKNTDLIDFWGFDAATDWDFATTNISLTTCSAGANAGGFSCGIGNADFNNVQAVSAPATGLLFGIGAAGLLVARRTHEKS
jgi:hypothetical protein